MPDRGLMEEAGIAEGIIDGTAPRELLLTGARVVQITFEVAQTAALAAMPGDVSRPVPPYGRLLVINSSIARFSLLMVGGRYNMLPRNVLVQGVVEGDPAGLARAIGGPLVAGNIELRRDGELLEAEISDAAGLLATVMLPRLRVVDPSMLRWDAWLTQARVGARTPLFEMVPHTELRAAYLSKGSTIQMENRPDGLWAGLRSLNMISACYAEGTLTLPPGTLQPPAA